MDELGIIEHGGSVRREADVDWGFLATLGLAAVVGLVVWSSPLVSPIRLFVTLIHELSHALAAIATGGRVDAILVDAAANGSTATRGGNLLVVAMAGYLGSTLVGGGLLALAKWGRWNRGVLRAIAIVLVGTALLLVRNPFGLVTALALAAGCWLLASVGPAWVVRLAISLLALLNCLYAVGDLTGLVARATFGAGNDAALMQQATGIPAVVWAIAWLGLSLTVLAALGKRLIRT